MQTLIEILKLPIGKSKVEQLAAIASEKAFSVKDLIDLSFHADEQTGFRAAWILENVYSKKPELFTPHSIYFLDKFSSQTNLSALRHYVKILALMTNKKAPQDIKNVITIYNTDNIVEIVFAWLIDINIPVAIKSHCLNVLANFIPKHNWIKEELIETMEFLIDKQSIAFFAKVKQIRQQLKSKNHQN